MELSKNLKNIIQDMQDYTDMFPWYWYSYGEKCYAFAVVSAVAKNEEEDELAEREAGCQLLNYNPKSDEPAEWDKWFTPSGIEMCIMDGIVNNEDQNGSIICKFVAEAHAELVLGIKNGR